MGWLHSVFFGGSGDNVEQELDASYGGNVVYNSTSNEEQSRIVIASERGWGHEQEGVMSNAYTSGRVTWWQRITGQG